MNYIKITIPVADDEQSDILVAMLEQLLFEGFEQSDNFLYAFTHEQNWDETAFNSLANSFPFIYSKEIMPQQNWNRLWEESFEPVIIEKTVAVRADFHSPIENISHEIVITPKMSFGTGHHATTFLMMQQMLSLNFINKHVFDFGTGTGILAIFAEMLGASKVQAIDIDEWSITNAKENIAANNCSRIELLLSSSADKIDNCDIILANINKNIILTNLPSLSNRLNANGTMLLSGLLMQDEKDILNKCAMLNLHHRATFSKDNWICISVKFP